MFYQSAGLSQIIEQYFYLVIAFPLPANQSLQTTTTYFLTPMIALLERAAGGRMQKYK